MFTCKNNSLAWVSCPKNLDIAFSFTVYILREKNKAKKVSIKKVKNMILVFLGTFKRSSFGLQWTANQVFIRSSFEKFSMNTKTGHTAYVVVSNTSSWWSYIGKFLQSTGLLRLVYLTLSSAP